ncbi:LysR family transcriptional regulator [Acidiferrimicrobium sp. IK]|uniref:LysR family transcriptional regulator n=1 Tax=Acidiferrimicrobium sp. IK TaxID=2871700 RepID=UPI0021CB5D80|nr:LysR family transcriptional regulator [Acidiferrimicrobium sp. IK]MCU4185523.1 LysR family transcriptional regulator [Acidiferrimicrobium sp. IK]
MGAEHGDAVGYRSSALDVRRLSLFLAVVDHGGFSKAAHAVHLSQPALSQAVAELEAELGGPLFHRLGRSVSLTDAGAALVGPARSVLRSLDAARQVASELTGLARGRLELSALRTLSSDPLPELLGRFCRLYPQIDVRLASPDHPAELVEQIRSGEAEIGLTAVAGIPPGLVAVPIGAQSFQVVFPPGTQRGTGPVRPDELAAVSLIATPRGTSGRDLLDGWFAGAGLQATVAVETGQREAVVPLVLAGAGAALVPAGAARLAAAAGALTATVEPPLVRHLAVVHRPGPLTPAAGAFLALIAEAFPDGASAGAEAG